MAGFKSFADRTRVEFEPGITAIVGPNGCGKSNISDAIRWSLGEMSARSLRSQQMLDVIFNGTANRPSQGMSEVALTFDNSSRQIPLDYTEVTIARRLFRSGESEYFINKTQCRLKDLRDLFLDTGVGNDGYYMMAQGKIEFILASKPEERRELFEEAAGVSKYKARREEALRRLNKVEQDMLRLNDSLAIYKQQMDSLDTAVRKARQHQKLTEELRTLEIASLLHAHQQAQAQWEALHAQFEEKDRLLQELREDLSRRETKLLDARNQSDSLESEVLAMQKEVAQQESDWAKTEAERQAAQDRETDLTAAQERLKEESSQLLVATEEGQKNQETLAAEVEKLRAEFHAKNEKFKAEDQKARADQEKSQSQHKELEKTKARLLELVRLISHHRNETVRLTSLSIRYDEGSKSKQRELEKIQAKRATLDEQAAQQQLLASQSQDRLTTVQNALRAIENLQREAAEKLSEAEKAIQTARERLARLDAEKVSLERWLSRNPVAVAATAMRLEQLPGIHGPISELFKTSDPYKRMLERALGDRADYFVADTLNDAQAAIRFLSDAQKGWATFLVLDRVTQGDGMIPWADTPGTRSLAVQVDCANKFRTLLQHLLGKTYYVGATLFEEGLLRGGADPVGEGYQATPSELKRLTQEIAAQQQSLVETESRRDELKAAIAEREAERGPIEEDRNKIQVIAQVQQETLARLTDDAQMIATEERLLQGERDESLQGIAQTQKALEQEEILLTDLESEEKTLQETVHTQDTELHDLRAAIQAHQAVVSQLRVDAETMRERLLGKERESDATKRQHSLLEQRLAQARAEREGNDRRLEELAAVQEEKSTHLEALKATRGEQTQALDGVLNRRQDIQEQVRTQEQELSSCREALVQAQAQAQEAEFQSRTLEQDKARLEQALKDSWQLSIEEARSHYGELTPNPEELARIKRRLESLGAVNLAAPEEHAQLEERYHFLLTQQQDLLKAKDDLHQAIAKINATTREHFKTTFDQVRENFKGLYQTLFQGGEADLILTDEHNLLETGIDIVAQPPGKKLQNIALLSGGEKALTAIALLFAFFMVKPSPFCLLDEVDAPLDEANVGRFLRMVKSFSEKTQFIVITHNKRTMEMADVLYGVTMADLGISSLISVKLEDAKPRDVVAA